MLNISDLQLPYTPQQLKMLTKTFLMPITDLAFTKVLRARKGQLGRTTIRAPFILEMAEQDVFPSSYVGTAEGDLQILRQLLK